MTARAMRTSVALWVCLSVAIMIAWWSFSAADAGVRVGPVAPSRDLVEASPAAVRAPASPQQQAAGISVDAEEAAARSDAVTWWVYEVRQPAHRPPSADDYSMIASGSSDKFLPAVTLLTSTARGSRRFVVVEGRGKRWWVTADDALRDLQRVTSPPADGESDLRTTVWLVDHDTHVGIRCLLTAADGQPLGPIGPRAQLLLPAGFRGRVLRAGYVTASIEAYSTASTENRSTGAQTIVTELRRAASASGRLVGAKISSGSHLYLYDVDSQHQVHCVDVADDGLFQVSSISAGRYSATVRRSPGVVVEGRANHYFASRLAESGCAKTRASMGTVPRGLARRSAQGRRSLGPDMVCTRHATLRSSRRPVRGGEGRATTTR